MKAGSAIERVMDFLRDESGEVEQPTAAETAWAREQAARVLYQGEVLDEPTQRRFVEWCLRRFLVPEVQAVTLH